MRSSVVSNLAVIATVCLPMSCVRVFAADGPYELKYKFRPGEFLYYEVENTSKMTSRYAEQSEVVLNTSRTWKQLRVASVDQQGNAVLEPLIERVQLSARWDDRMPILYDSGFDENPPFQFQGIKKTVGVVQAKFHVNDRGELLEIVPIDKHDDALKEAANNRDPQLNFLVEFPKTPLRIGETWKNRFSTDVTVGKSLKQKVQLQRTYELAEVSGTIAIIKLKTSAVTGGSDPQIDVQLMQRTPSGVIEFDLARGIMLSMTMQVKKEVVNAIGPMSTVVSETKTVDKLLPGRPDLKSVSRITDAAVK